MKTKIRVIPFLLLIIYLCFSFIKADLNAFAWNIEARVVLVITFAFFSILLLTYPGDIK